MKRVGLLLFLILLTTLQAFPYSFESNGVYYYITSSTNMTVEVTYYSQTNNKYTGMVGIPATVTYNGKTYTVVGIGSYAFVGCTNLTGVNFTSKLITYIGERAFSGCNGMTSFAIPYWITSVGNYAFAGCYGITKVSFPESNNTLWLGYGSSKGSAHGLFEDCQLTSVEIRRPLNYYVDSKYGYSPFANQANLKSITFGSNVTRMPGNVFYGNNSISSYTVPSHITELSNYAFCGFEAKTITLNEKTETISDYCFSGCKNLTSISIPTGVTSIGEGAFQNSSIKNLVVHPMVKSIGNFAFNGCTALSELTIEESEETLSLGYNYYHASGGGKGLFYDCPLNSVFIGRNLSYKADNNNGFSPFANNGSLKKARLGNPVSSIQSYLFMNCSSFTTIEYNSKCSPTEIKAYAFYGCKSLAEPDIKFPETVNTIGEYAFGYCTSLLGYTIPNHVTTVGNYAFAGCEKLSNVIVKPSVKSIGNFVFNGCTALSELTIEESEETLSLGYNYYHASGGGKGLFYDCPLNSVFIGRNLSYKADNNNGFSPFANNGSLKKARLGNPVSSIQSYLFMNCSSFTTIEYNSKCSPTEIKAYAFYGCKSLTEPDIKFPETVNTIGEYAFGYCTSLLGYTIPNHVTTVGNYAFADCEKLSNVIVKPSVKSIGNFVFNGCTALSELTIEESEETLSLGYNYYHASGGGKGLFYDCPLNSVFIGRNLSYKADKYNGFSPFANNGSLKKARLGNPVSSIQSYLFMNCSSFTTIEYNSKCSPTEIKAYAFYGCKSLTEPDIKFPETVNTIGEYAFGYCTSLLGYTIPNHVTTVGNYAFVGCEKLSNVIVKPSVKSIGNFAFNGCTALSELTIEESEETLSLGYNYYQASGLGKGLFYDCPLNSVFLGRNLSYKNTQQYGYTPFDSSPLTKVRFGNPVTSIQSYLFFNCSKLEELNYNSECAPISVGDYAFAGCKALTQESMGLPESVKTIGNGAFLNCTGFQEYTIPAHVTSIGNFAFNGCTSMTSVTIEDCEETLSLGFGSNSGSTSKEGKSLFSDCPLTSVYLGRHLNYNTNMQYGYSPFARTASLTSITFGEPVTSISAQLLRGCTGIESLTIPERVTSIGKSAFIDCSNLAEITLPSTLKTMDTYVFYGCSSLTEMTIPASVTSIGSYSFGGCTGITNLIIEDSEETLSLGYGSDSGSTSRDGNSLFYDCPLASVYVGRNISYDSSTRYGYSPFARIPSLHNYIMNDKVAYIGSQLLRGCTGIESLIIPEGVTSIGKSAFAYCTNLAEITLPSTLKTMDTYVFYECSSLTDMTIPASVTSIGSYSFNGCMGLANLIIEDSDETLSLGYGSDSGTSNTAGKGLFFDCPLAFAYVGRKISYDSSTRYGYSPFALIPSLQDFIINEKWTDIGAQLLRGCTGIESLIIPEGVTSIGKSAFAYCSNLAEITLPSTLKTMDTYVFYECSSLTDMTIPASVTSIGSYSFNGCMRLANLIIEDSDATLSLGYASDSGSSSKAGKGMFVDCPLESLYLGHSVSYDSSTRYGYSPFMDQVNLSKLIIGNDVKAIGANQFWGCSSLKSVYLPATLKSIHTSSFGNCSSLEQLICLALYPPMMNGNTSFMSGTAEGSLVYVFFADTYKATKGWSSSYAPITSLGSFDANFSYTGHVQNITYDTAFPIYMSNLETMVDAGTYTKNIELDYSFDGETYHNSFPYEYTIKKAIITVTADNQTKVYGDDNPEFTISYEGFVNNEDESELSSAPIVSTKATKTSNAGTYALTVSGGEAANYSFNYVNGILTIEKAPQEITWEIDYTDLEVGDVIEFDATVTSGLLLTYTTSDVTILPLSKKDGKVRATCKATGEAAITVSQSGNDNYLAAESISYTFKVVPTGIESISYDKNNDSKVYDMQGREILTPQNGFYIVNGKKIYYK